MITSIFPSQRFWSAPFCIFKYSGAHEKLLTWEGGLPGTSNFYRYVIRRVYHFDKKCSGYLLFFSQMIIFEYIFIVFISSQVRTPEQTTVAKEIQRAVESGDEDTILRDCPLFPQNPDEMQYLLDFAQFHKSSFIPKQVLWTNTDKRMALISFT